MDERFAKKDTDDSLPEEVFEAELMPLFGGYYGYWDAPAEAVLRHKLRLIAQRIAAAEDREEQERQNNSAVSD